MTAPGHELQVLLLSTLKADATLMALVNGVYDTPPDKPWGDRLAYISFGPSDVLTDDADCVDGEEHNIQIDVWSRAVGAVECKKICAAVKATLHGQELELSDNALCEIRVNGYRTLRDPDGLTTHGVVDVVAFIEVT
jgi:hypothetical protein